MPVTNEQLAELLIGIARSQKAIIEAIVMHLGQADGLRFRTGAVIPTLQQYAGLANPRAQPTLNDLPARLLLQMQGGRQPGTPRLEDWLSQELARLIP